MKGLNQNFTNKIIDLKDLNQFGYDLINGASVIGSSDSPNESP